MSDSLPNRAERLHGLDWLRAISALAVVALHAGIAYTIRPFPGLAWPVHDSQPSAIVDALTWWIDAWIMPVFFLIGGFLAAQLSARLGPAAFLKHRARRLLVPLAFACIVILPLDLYVWLLGWVVEDRIPLKKLRSLKLGEAGRELWGIAHLWFLEYLLVFCVAAWVARWGWERWRSRRGRLRQAAFDDPGGRAMSDYAGDHGDKPRGSLALQSMVMCGLAACSAIALWWDPQLVIGFRHAWHPLPANVLYYAPCFAAGWWLQTRGTAVRGQSRWLMASVVASPVLLAAVLPLIHEFAATGLTGTPRVVLAAAFTACGWLMALGAFALSLRPCAAPPKSVRYIAQASFWMYLLHHPAVGLAQVALHGSSLTAEAKFVLVWSSATALSLLTYEAFVRRTWIGVLLNGRREAGDVRPTVEPVPAAAVTDSPLRRAA